MNLGVFETLGIGVLALLLGRYLNGKIAFFREICIPDPVTGGFVISLLALIIHHFGGLDIVFDNTLKDICMLLFFTTAGFQCDFKVLKYGGRALVIIVLLLIVLIVFQNLTGVGLSKLMGLNPLLGLAAGSITMTGGHGTAGGFSALLESMGLAGAAPITMAAATFGLISGSIMGGPLGKSLIAKYHLKCGESSEDSLSVTDSDGGGGGNKRMAAVCAISLAAAGGSLLSRLIALAGITVPTYFGALIMALIIRNISEGFKTLPKLPVSHIISIGYNCLTLFLGMALASLRLWELAELALPLMVILSAQVLLMYLFARFLAFPLMGKNYDAAVLTGGFCGFGLGATPNAMANMNAISGKYGYSPLPFIVVPIVGAAFTDIINVSVISIFLNILS